MLPYERFSVKRVGFVEHFFTSYRFSQSASNGAIALMHNFVILSMRNSYGLFNKNDEYHASARASFSSISEPLITTYPVVTETCYLLCNRLGHHSQINFLKSITKKAFNNTLAKKRV